MVRALFSVYGLEVKKKGKTRIENRLLETLLHGSMDGDRKNAKTSKDMEDPRTNDIPSTPQTVANLA